MIKHMASKSNQRARGVMVLLVLFMTSFIVAKSVQAETRLLAFATVAHSHNPDVNESSEIKMNLASEPDAGSGEDPDDNGTSDSLVDLDLDHFLLSPLHFDFGIAKTHVRHPRIDMSLTLPSHAFGLEYPPDLV